MHRIPFKLKAPFQPTGDQPEAIRKLTESVTAGAWHTTLVGVTGSGKTFTLANVVEHIQRPTLVISHNKTLAAQLYQELKEFFPENSVHYFVSYYDYYQPEAYIPQTDTYIEKDAKINDLIDSLRHAATASVLTRSDTIIVASVSCIYGLGNPEAYENASIEIGAGERVPPRALAKKLTALQYQRNAVDPRRGEFRVRGGIFEIHTPSGEEIIDIEIEKDTVRSISMRRPELDAPRSTFHATRIFPGKHFVPPQEKLEIALENIKDELHERLAYLKKEGKLVEAQRLEERTNYDIEMIRTMGYAPGIENYSRHLDFRRSGEPPSTLIDYFRRAHPHFLTIIDESHATVPQLRGMYAGDRSRKETLVQYGFRLPSAIDNRPLQFSEFRDRVGQIIYASATPNEYELEKSGSSIAEQLIRPTGLLDPELEIRPTKGQMQDIVDEIKHRVLRNERSLVLTLTKRLAEDVSDFLKEHGIKTEYIHSDIATLERPEILAKLRRGNFDALVGINLLREGLDLPEVSFIAILDADKEGFLRNETTLLQIIGRAARHINGRVIFYADTATGSMKSATNITNRRRTIQREYNELNGIVPQPIVKTIRPSIIEKFDERPSPEEPAELPMTAGAAEKKRFIAGLEREMKKAAAQMDFERAAKLRDRIEKLKRNEW